MGLRHTSTDLSFMDDHDAHDDFFFSVILKLKNENINFSSVTKAHFFCLRTGRDRIERLAHRPREPRCVPELFRSPRTPGPERGGSVKRES